MEKPRALVRQWTLLRVLSQHVEGLSIEEMARQTSVHTRTIRRDLNLFVEAGIPLRQTARRRNKKVWRIESHGIKILTNDAMEECMALLVTECLFESLEGTHFLSAIARCRSRMAGALRHPVRKLLEEEVSRLKSNGSNTIPWSLTNDVVESLWAKLAITCKSVTVRTPEEEVAAPNGYRRPPRAAHAHQLEVPAGRRRR